MALLQLLAHAEQRSHSPTGTGAADCAEAEFLDNARDVFTVKAAAGHDGYFLISKLVRCRNHATMPETPDTRRPGAMCVTKTAGLRKKLIAQRGADQADQEISRPGNEPEFNAIREGERADTFAFCRRLGCFIHKVSIRVMFKSRMRAEEPWPRKVLKCPTGTDSRFSDLMSLLSDSVPSLLSG